MERIINNMRQFVYGNVVRQSKRQVLGLLHTMRRGPNGATGVSNGVNNTYNKIRVPSFPTE